MAFRDKSKDGTTRLTGGLVSEGITLDDVYPVDSIYLSVSPTNPAASFGGTWVSWGSGRVPVGVDAGQSEFDTVEETGGAKTVTLVSGNLPPHTHVIDHDHANASMEFQFAADVAATGSSVRVSDIQDLTGAGGTSTSASINSPAFAGSSGSGPGSSTPVDNLPPYITCYMWKRTA